MRRTEVVTYQHAYVPGEVSLCHDHAEQPPAWVPALGPVSHGEHEGACAACEGYDNGGHVSNARLIAAAPDLLEAARAAEDRISAWMDGERAAQLAAEQRNDRHAAEGHWNAVKNYETLLSTLRAAIAKATTGE